MVLTDLTSPGSTGNYEACGQLPLPVIWKEIYRPEITFSREYTVHTVTWRDLVLETRRPLAVEPFTLQAEPGTISARRGLGEGWCT